MPAPSPSLRLTRRLEHALDAVLAQLQPLEAHPTRPLLPSHRETIDRLLHTVAAATARQTGDGWRLPLPARATWGNAKDALTLALKALLVARDRLRAAHPAPAPGRRRRRVRHVAKTPLGPELPLPFIPEPPPAPEPTPEPPSPPVRRQPSRTVRTPVLRLGLAGEPIDMREQHTRSILGW
ncbi:MAG: hypothetical protein ACO1OG_12145 [Devosia sp.]